MTTIDVDTILKSVPDYIQKVRCSTNERTPPFKCAVLSCPNLFRNYKEASSYSYKFHEFPKLPALLEIWKKKCGLKLNTDVSELMVCSDHFSLDDYQRNYKEEFRNPNFKRNLKSDAVPTRNVNNDDTANDGDNENDKIFKDSPKKRKKVSPHLQEEYDSLLKEANTLEKLIEEEREKSRQFLLRQQSKLYQQKSKVAVTNKWLAKSGLYKIFSSAQIELLNGKERVRWSDDDMARAFVMRHMGTKKCYLYLKNSLNFPLPSLTNVQKWAASRNTTDINK